MFSTQSFFRYLIECVEHEIDTNVFCRYPDDSRKDPHWTFFSNFPAVTDSKISRHFLDSEEISQVIQMGEDVKLKNSRYVFGYPVVKYHEKGKPILYPVYYWRVVDVRTGKVVGPYINEFFIRWVLRSQADYECFTEMLRAEGFEFDSRISNLKTITDVIQHFVSLKAAWTRDKVLDCNHLSTDPIDESEKEGIYNRAMFAAATSVQYSQNLLKELEELSQKSAKDIEGTALATMLNRLFDEKEQTAAEPWAAPIVEVKNIMNEAQRQAVREALSAQLSVIQGPPGTGKTQVVKNLYKNALLAGQSVLFSSKNHEAIHAVVGANNSALDIFNLVQKKPEDEGKRSSQILVELYKDRVEALEKHLSDKPVNSSKLIRLMDDLKCAEDERAAIKCEEEKIVSKLNELRGYAQARDSFLADFPLASEEKVPFYSILKLQCMRLRAAIQSYGRLSHTHPKGLKALAKPIVLMIRKHFVQKQLDQVNAYLAQEQQTLNGMEFWEDNAAVAMKLLRQMTNRLDNLEDYEHYCQALKELDRLASLAEVNYDLYLKDQIRKNISEEIMALEMGVVFGGRMTKPKLSALRAAAEKALKQSEHLPSFMKLATEMIPAVAVTTLSADGRIPLVAGMYDLLIIDEAGQVDPISVVPLLYRAKRVAVIGDPKQLPPIISLPKTVFSQISDKYEDLGLRWPYLPNYSFFDIAKEANGNRMNFLSSHYRCDPDISEFSSQNYYDGELINAAHFDASLRPYPDKKGIVLYEVENNSVSDKNIFEAEGQKVLELVEDLTHRRQLSASEIGVIAPFRDQKAYLKNLLKDYVQEGLKVDTAHGFQGGEKIVIIYSACVSNGMRESAKQFLETTDNLFNVAITRAKRQLLVVLDRNAVYRSGLKRLGLFVDYVDRLGEAKEQKTFDDSRVSDVETQMAQALDDLGIEYSQQEHIGPYYLDFAIYAGKAKLDLEVDGETYHMTVSGGQRFYDRQRDEFMFDHGWSVMRFWACGVKNDPQAKAKQVLEWVKKQYQAQGLEFKKPCANDSFKKEAGQYAD